MSAGSWNGGSPPLVAGFGMQTVNLPLAAGISSAPGKVPKYESNDRFSCMITTTCLMTWIPAPRTTPWTGVGNDADVEGPAADVDVHVERCDEDDDVERCHYHM